LTEGVLTGGFFHLDSNKCYPGIIPEQNALIRNDTQPYQLEPEEPLQDEDDSDCFEESGII